MVKDLFQSVNLEYLFDIVKAKNPNNCIKKSNPYNLSFNKVSEEDIIKGAIKSGVAVFLHGPSSEGKSARVKQIDPTCEIIYLRNATPDSLNGKSVYNSETGEMIDVQPTWLKKLQSKCEQDPDRLHILFFDEITNALPSIQGIAFNIVLDREVNGIWKLPDDAESINLLFKITNKELKNLSGKCKVIIPNNFKDLKINVLEDKYLNNFTQRKIGNLYNFFA